MERCAKVFPISHVHSDSRRTIFELNNPALPQNLEYDSRVGRIQVFHINESASLGNHYHKRNEESFVILSGSCSLVTCDIMDVNQKKIVHKIDSPTLVVIPNYVAHLFRFESPGLMMCLASKPFDENDKDTIPWKLD